DALPIFAANSSSSRSVMADPSCSHLPNLASYSSMPIPKHGHSGLPNSPQSSTFDGATPHISHTSTFTGRPSPISTTRNCCGLSSISLRIVHLPLILLIPHPLCGRRRGRRQCASSLLPQVQQAPVPWLQAQAPPPAPPRPARAADRPARGSALPGGCRSGVRRTLGTASHARRCI